MCAQCTIAHNKWWIRYFGLMVRITSLTIMLIWKSLLAAHLMAGLGRFWTDGNWQEGHRRNLELILLIKCSFGWMRCNYPINGAKLAKTPLWSGQNAKTDFFAFLGYLVFLNPSLIHRHHHHHHHHGQWKSGEGLPSHFSNELSALNVFRSTRAWTHFPVRKTFKRFQ